MNLNKFLLILASSILAAIIFVSAVFLSTQKILPKKQNQLDQNETSQAVFKSKKIPCFSKIDQIRTKTKIDKNGNFSTVVISVTFEFQGEDFSFREEFDSKRPEIKNLISTYFNSFTENEIQKKGELKIKAELLSKINEMLVLQKFTEIYFDEYMFF